MIRKSQPSKSMGSSKKYIESLEFGLNDVNTLAAYLRTMAGVRDSPVRIFNSETMETEAFKEFQSKTFGLYLDDKSKFQLYLDQTSKDLVKAPSNIPRSIRSVTGDADHAKNPTRQELYKEITSSGVHMQTMMNIEPWTMQNAEILQSVGVKVMHLATPQNYHFGIIGDKMYTLFREPVSEESRKVVGEPQQPEDVNYYFLATNQSGFVDYTNELWNKLKTMAISFDDQKARLSRNRDSGEITSKLINNH